MGGDIEENRRKTCRKGRGCLLAWEHKKADKAVSLACFYIIVAIHPHSIVPVGELLLFSLPLDGTSGFGSEVVEHAVHSWHLGDNSLGDVVEKWVGNLLDGGSHRIASVHGTNDDGPVPAALVFLHAS